MTNKTAEAIERVNKYLTRRFICDPKLLPDDECEKEARKILKILKSLGYVQKAEDQPTIICPGKIVLTIGCNMRTDDDIFGKMTSTERQEIKFRLVGLK